MIALRRTFFFQTGFGLTANTFLLLFRLCSFLLAHRLKPTDLTTSHLALVHLVMFLTMVLRVSPDLFQSLPFQNDIKSKTLMYVSRVMRVLSLGTACLLSVIQAVTISPSTSWLAKFKPKLTDYIAQAYVFLWSFSLSSNSCMVFYIVAFSNVNQTNLLNLNKLSSLSLMDSIVGHLCFVLMVCGNAFFVGVMLLSSAYMVILLFKHRRQSQHLRSTSLSPQTSREQRATQTILLLLGFCVITSLTEFTLSSLSGLILTYVPVFMEAQKILGNAFAAASPLVLLSSDRGLINTLQNMQQKFHQFLAIYSEKTVSEKYSSAFG